MTCIVSTIQYIKNSGNWRVWSLVCLVRGGITMFELLYIPFVLCRYWCRRKQNSKVERGNSCFPTKHECGACYGARAGHIAHHAQGTFLQVYGTFVWRVSFLCSPLSIFLSFSSFALQFFTPNSSSCMCLINNKIHLVHDF